MTWHLPARQLADYATGQLDHAAAMSVEAHLLNCRACRDRMPADEGWLAAQWADLRDTVDQPRPGLVERVLTAAGVNEATAHLLVATPMLYRAWLLGMVAVLGCALGAAYVLRDGSLLFLGLAPVLPLVGVALAYGRSVDPVYEVTSVTPMAGHRLLLLRAVAVLVPAIALCSAAAIGLPGGPGWSAAGWLLPALALATGSLTLMRWWPPLVSTGLLGGCWLALLGLVAASGPRGAAYELFTPAAQGAYAALLVLFMAGYFLLRPRRS